MRTNTKSNPFLGALRQVALAIGKREGINIVFQGSGAKTDGQTIYLPSALPADDEEIEILLRGFLDHEVGHIKHTDFSLPTPSHPLIHTLTNIVEDIRIERAMGYEYPGCAVNLRENVNYLRDTGKIKVDKKPDPVGACLMAISYGARVMHLRNDLKKEAEGYRKAALELLGQPAAKVIDQAVLASGSLTSTQEARKLAEQTFLQLKQLLDEPPQPPQPEPQPQQSDDSKQDQEEQDQQQSGEGQEDQDDSGAGEGQEDGNNQQDGQGNSSSDSSQDQDGQGDQPGADGSDESQSDSNSSGSSAGGAGQDSQEPGLNKPMSAKQRQNLEDLLDSSQEDLAKAEKKTDVGDQTKTAINKGKDAESASALADSNGDTGLVETGESWAGGNHPQQIEWVSEATLKTVGLRGKLAGLFQASKLKRDNPKLTGIKIDRRAVHRLAANTPDTRIFQQRREKVDNNTAITILVDRSGSMSGGRIITATASALSIAKAVESMPDVCCQVGAFPSNSGRSGVLSLKDFGAKPKLERFAVTATGGTPTDIALRWAGQTTWPRRENRKIVLMLTDGDANDPQKAKVMADLLIENGIECYGIGIGAGTGYSVRRLFGDHSKEIEGVEQLADAMFDTLIGAMAKRR